MGHEFSSDQERFASVLTGDEFVFSHFDPVVAQLKPPLLLLSNPVGAPTHAASGLKKQAQHVEDASIFKSRRTELPTQPSGLLPRKPRITLI